jgi:hypothetical protein
MADGGEIEFVAAHAMVTLALPDFELSAVLVAVTVTVAGDGVAAGAVYKAVAAPVATIVPTVALPPAIPLTPQVTPATELPAPVTLAVNTCAPLVGTLAVPGDTVTTIESSKPTIAEALACESAWLTALTVTFGGDGRFAGAEYTAVPGAFAAIVPTFEFPPGTPLTSHVTVVFEVPVTMA